MATELLLIAETDEPAESASTAVWSKNALADLEPVARDGRGGALAVVTVRTRTPRAPARHANLLVAEVDESPTLPLRRPVNPPGSATTSGRAHVYRPIQDWVGEQPRDPSGEPWRRMLFYVLTWAVPGTEAEFNRWYSGEHLADVTAIEGFSAARRYQPLSRPGYPAPEPGHYLALYLLDGDPNAALDRLAEVKRSGQMKISPTLDHSEAFVYQPIAG
jgi:hypothetical protein